MRSRKIKRRRRPVLPAVILMSAVTAAACFAHTDAPPAEQSARVQAAFASAVPEEAAQALLSSAAPQEAAQAPAPLDVPWIDQREDFPTGCESCCAAMALQYAGVDCSADAFIDWYLPTGTAPYQNEDGVLIGCDPCEKFPGDPRTDAGWGCYAPVIEKALRDVLWDYDDLTVYDLSGASLQSVYEQSVAQGRPALIWVTIDMEPPQVSDWFYLEDSDELFEWIYPMHCVVLTGKTEDGYYCNDPMRGKNTFYEKEAVETAFEGLGRQALAIGL